MWAADNGHTEVVKILIKNGAAPNTQDLDVWTALMKAVYKKHVEIVQTLIKNGAVQTLIQKILGDIPLCLL